jgi:signal transduction histidine kinase
MGVFAVGAAWGRVAANRTLSRQLRRAWFILGLSALMLFLGDAAYLVIEQVFRLSAEIYNLPDYLYLMFYPLVVLGLMTLPGVTTSPEGRWRFVVDMGIVVTAAGLAIWYFLITPLAAQVGATTVEDNVWAAAYPIGDLALIAGLTAILFRRREPATRSSLVLFFLGLLGFVGFDFLNALNTLTNSEPGYVPNLLWLQAYLFFGLAALRQPYLQRNSFTEQWSEQLVKTASLVLPFAAIGLGYGLVILALTLAPGQHVRGLLTGAGLLTLFVIGRQWLALRENARLTQELIELSADLERRVQKRSRELQRSQERLTASQRLASVGALAAGVVHEISNPLNTIITAGETLEAQIDSGTPDLETLRLYIPVINRAAWHGARVMQALRNFSRSNQPQLAQQALDEIIQDAQVLLGHSLRTGALTQVVVNVDPHLPRILCDRHQITQVIINLLTNAREAMPNGGTITLTARPADAYVLLSVRDEGVGIPPEAQSKIFDPFYTTKEAGSGLGLSIVAGIVRAHHGKIEVKSDGPGTGTTLTVMLPVR